MNFHALPVTHLREVINVITCNRRPQEEQPALTDESLLLGQRLCKIAHIPRALQKAKDPCKVCALQGSCTHVYWHGRLGGRGDWKSAQRSSAWAESSSISVSNSSL